MTAPNRSRDETEIRQLIDGRLKAIRAKDVEATMAPCAPDILSFDLAPPLQYRGAAVNRKSLEEWFITFRGSVGYELRDLSITAADEVPFCHALNRARRRGYHTSGT